MDIINQNFQELLATRNFQMKVEEKKDSYVYTGRFQLEDTHHIGINVMLTKGEQHAVGQIVYEDIAYCRKQSERSEWLKVLNDLNSHEGVYYYFCLNEENRIFMRYVTEVTPDLETFFNILIQGPYLIERVIKQLEKKFGAFVVV